MQDGTAGAVHLARPYVTEPVLIIFVDTVFEADLTLINRTDADGIIWAKEVEDYQRFGVVVTDADGFMTRIVEKPSEPISKLANIGLYYIRDTDDALAAASTTCSSRPANRGEFFLTDAFQYMIEHGKRILTAEVGGWYDCGTRDAIIETNETLLRKGSARRPALPESVTIHEPVLVEAGATIERSTIGPNVTIEKGTTVLDSHLAHTIVGRSCHLTAGPAHPVPAGRPGPDPRRQRLRQPGRPRRVASVSLTDELCVSFRDLEAHFDPAQQGRLGRFDPATVREHLAAFRALEAGVEELEVEDAADEIDRTALLDDIRITIFRFQHERPQVRNPGFWLEHLCEAGWTGGRADGRTGSSSLEFLKSIPEFLQAAEETLKDPPSILVDLGRALVQPAAELIAAHGTSHRGRSRAPRGRRSPPRPRSPGSPPTWKPSYPATPRSIRPGWVRNSSSECSTSGTRRVPARARCGATCSGSSIPGRSRQGGGTPGARSSGPAR